MPKKKGRSTEFDLHLGTRLKFFRQSKGITQADLAKELGITFQQLQKYESGKNRISATKLYEIADFLGLKLIDLYDGYHNETAKSKVPVNDAVEDPDLAKLFQYWQKISDPNLKRSLLALLKNYTAGDADIASAKKPAKSKTARA